MLIETVLAYFPMRNNLLAVFVVLAVGLGVLISIRRGSRRTRKSWHAPVIAFACGPGLAGVFYLADILWLGRQNYLNPSDYFGTFWRMMVIGLIAGSLGAVASWLSRRVH